MLYLDIRKIMHDFLDDHEYALPLATVDVLDGKLAETLALWDAEKLYFCGVSSNEKTQSEFVGQLIDILEDTLEADESIRDCCDFDDEDASAVIVGDDYDALSGHIKEAISKYGMFTWKEIVCAIPIPCDERELNALELAMMVRTITCASRISPGDAERIVARFHQIVCDRGSALLSQEIAYAICDLASQNERIVTALMELDDEGFLNRVAGQAVAYMEKAIEATQFENN